MKHIVTGVQCDEKDCDWILPNAQIIDWLNKPCPKCGKGIIITQEELDYCTKIQENDLSTVIEALEKFPIKGFNNETKSIVLDLKNMRDKIKDE